MTLHLQDLSQSPPIERLSSWFDWLNNLLTNERKIWLALIVATAFVSYGLGNGHTTENSIASLANRNGVLTKTVHVLKTTQVDNSKPTTGNPLAGNLSKTGPK